MNRKVAPEIIDAVNFNLHIKPYQLFHLDNGVPVYSLHAGEQEVMQIEMVFYAGSWYEKQKLAAAATNSLLKNGTKEKTAFQIAEAFDYYGAHSSRASYSETAVLNLHTLTKHLDVLLPVMTDMLTNAVFPEKELEIFKQNSLQRLSVNLQKPGFVANRLIDSYVYGPEHPYGYFSKAEDIESITREHLVDFYNEHYVHGECAIFVSGFLPSNIQEVLNKNFGTLTLKKPSFKSPGRTQERAAQKQYRIQNDPDAVQGAIRLARPFVNRQHEDFKKVTVLNNIFGGFFGSRLMSNIREEKGYTYGIHSYVQNHIDNSAWLISTEAGKDVCEPTLEEIYKEMKLLREVPVDAEELLLVKNYIMGSVLSSLDGPFQIMSRWKQIILNGLDENFFYESIKAVRDSSPEEIMAMANKYLQPDDFYELIVY